MEEKPIISLVVMSAWVLFYYFFAWRSYRLYWQALEHKDENETPLRYFMQMFFWMGTFLLFHWVPVAALFIGGPYADPEWFKIAHPWSHLMGHIFMHISFAYGALIAAHFSWPALKPYIFGWIIILGVFVGTVATILYPQVTEFSGPVITGGDSTLVGIITALGALGFLYAGVVFLYWSFKGNERMFRIRSLLIGLGFIIFFIAGPMNDAAGSLTEVLPAYILVIIAVCLKGIGILMKGSLKKPTPA